MFDARPAVGVIEHDILGLDRHEKLPFGRIEKGKIRQIALERQLGLAGFAGNQRITQPVPRRIANGMRDVAPDGARIGVRQCGLEVNVSRALSLFAVHAGSRAGGFRIGEGKPRQINIQPRLAEGPAGLRIQALQLRPRNREDPRQINAGACAVQREVAALFIDRGLPRQTGKPRQIALGVERQALEAALQRIRFQIAGNGVALPAGIEAGELPARMVCGKESADIRRQRQIRRQLTQSAQVDLVGRQAARGIVPLRIRIPGKPEIHRGDADAGGSIRAGVGGFRRRRFGGRRLLGCSHQRQLAAARNDAAIRPLHAHPAGGLGQREHRQLRMQLHGDIAQQQIGGHLTQRAAFDSRPETQGALTARKRQRIVDPLPPGRQIDIIDFGKNMTFPVIKAIDIAAGKIAANIDVRSQRRRRLRRQAETSPPAEIVEAEIQRFQAQRRRLPHSIFPDQRGVMDTDAALGEHPVRKCRTARLIIGQRDPGNKKAAVGVAAQIQRRLIDTQQAQLERAAGHGQPGHDRLDARESQRRPAFGVEHTHVEQVEIGINAVPACLDAPDADRLAERPAGEPLDGWAIHLDIGQNAVAQRQHECDKAEINNPERPPQRAPKPPDRRRCPQTRHPGKSAGQPLLKGMDEPARHQRPLAGGEFCQFLRCVTRMPERMNRGSAIVLQTSAPAVRTGSGRAENACKEAPRSPRG